MWPAGRFVAFVFTAAVDCDSGDDGADTGDDDELRLLSRETVVHALAAHAAETPNLRSKPFMRSPRNPKLAKFRTLSSFQSAFDDADGFLPLECCVVPTEKAGRQIFSSMCYRRSTPILLQTSAKQEHSSRSVCLLVL